MKKAVNVFLWILLVLLALALILAGLAAWEWRKCSMSTEGPVVIEKPGLPDGKIQIGDRIPVTIKVRTPWARVPASFVLTPGEGSQIAAEPVAESGSYRWGTTVWTVSAVVQPWKSGMVPEGKFEVLFEGGADGRSAVTEAVPPFEALSPEISGTDLHLAEAFQPQPESRFRGILVIVLAVILGVVIFIILYRLRKSAGNTPIPFWVQALDAISILQERLHTRTLPPEYAVADLTDIVRRYLEHRFHLRAEHQTTREFLNELKDDSGPLNRNHRNFLGQFLNSADMVKFAKVPADNTLFDSAAEKAGELIRSTIPQEPAKKGKGKKQKNKEGKEDKQNA